MNRTKPPREVEIAAARTRLPEAERKRQLRFAPAKDRNQKEERDPQHALKMQRRLASVPYGTRTRVKTQLVERDSFDEFSLLDVVKQSISEQALRGLVDIAPTPIQRLAIPAMIGSGDKRSKRSSKMSSEDKKPMEQFLLAAETGSGKTLAYLLPVIDALKRAEQADAAIAAKEAAKQPPLPVHDALDKFSVEPPKNTSSHPTTARPRVIILLPTAELVAQVGSIVKSLSHTVKYRSAMISSAFTGTVIRNRLFSTSGIDVVVATPHLISSITESDPNILARCTHLVIDEADSLLDRSFSPITQGIIDRATPSLQQLIFCSATIPRTLDSYLHKRYPETRRLATPNLHAIPRRVQLTVLDIDKIPYQGNRDLACAQTILDIGKNSEASDSDSGSGDQKIIVFVNERETSSALAKYLASKGINAYEFSRDSDQRKQAEIMSLFTGTGQTDSLPPSPGRNGQRGSNTTVLVTTDITSRGIDTYPVKNVILYDVPHTSIDFIHRLGRVGRMGRRGRGVVLVGRHDRKDIVKEVREGMFRGAALI
jgi:ATP-dependent RNA helicase MRH4